MTTDRKIAFDDLVACPGCDLLHYRIALAPGESARCERCADVLQTCRPQTVDRSLAAALASLVLLALAVTQPFLGLSRSGISSSISVIDAPLALWNSDFRWLGLLALALIVLLPLARLLLLAFVLLRLKLERPAGDLSRQAFRWAIALEPWAMADIFMIGVAVALVKIGTVARLEVGLAFWALVGTILVSIYLDRVLCRDTVWQQMTQEKPAVCPPEIESGSPTSIFGADSA